MDDHVIFAGEALNAVEAALLQPIRDKRFYMACLDLEGRDCLVVGAGRDDHFGEQLGDLGRGRPIDRAIERDDAAEGRDRIADQCLGVGVETIAAKRDPTRVGVFDDRAGRLRELGHQFIRRVGVVDIVVAEFLALDLQRRSYPCALLAGHVERGGLVRVLAVT